MKKIAAIVVAFAICLINISVNAYGNDLKNSKENTAINSEDNDASYYGKLSEVVNNAYSYITDTYADGNKKFINDEIANSAGNSTTDWLVIALSRLEIEDNYELYLDKLTEYVNSKYETEGGLSSTKATEYHRIALAILACNGNPMCVGKNKIDLIKDGIYDRKEASLDNQGINGLIWALITLDARDYETPEGAIYSRNTIIESIITKQMKDGGFGMTKEQADADVTSMAIVALSNYYESTDKYIIVPEDTKEMYETTVKEVVDKAVEALSKMQLENGDYTSDGLPNASSIAQAIIALTSLNIDIFSDQRFIKNGNNLLDRLLSYKMDEGGFYRETQNGKVIDLIDTEQALLAICSILRQSDQKEKIYDFSNEIINNVESTKSDNKINYYVIICVLVAIIIMFVICVTTISHRKRRKLQEN